MYERRVSGASGVNAAEAYKANQVKTATPLGLVIMLYDGAVSFLAKAEGAARSGDWEGASGLIRKAQDIVYELMACLDMEKGGQLAANLFRIYEYMGYRLVQAQLRRDPAPAAEVREHLESLKEAWEEAERKLRAASCKEGRLAAL
jgi:flagellar protein FliS